MRNCKCNAGGGPRGQDSFFFWGGGGRGAPFRPFLVWSGRSRLEARNILTRHEAACWRRELKESMIAASFAKTLVIYRMEISQESQKRENRQKLGNLPILAFFWGVLTLPLEQVSTRAGAQGSAAASYRLLFWGKGGRPAGSRALPEETRPAQKRTRHLIASKTIQERNGITLLN